MTVCEALQIEQAIWSARPSVFNTEAEEQRLAALGGHLRRVNLHLPDAVIAEPALSFLRELEGRVIRQKSKSKNGKQRKARSKAA